MLPNVSAWLESETGTRHPLNGPCYLGRLPGNQIVIEDARVSRRHALINPQAGVGCWLLDFGSSNGVQINRRLLLKPTLLQNFDRITIGGSSFSFRQSLDDTSARRDPAVPKTKHIAEAFAAVEHHTILLDCEGLARGQDAGAIELLRRFFPEPFAWPALPRTLRRWIQQQDQAPTPGADGNVLPEPFVIRMEERRLVIRFKPISQNQSLVMLTEERGALSPEILQRLGLSEREGEILRWMAQGVSNPEIAALLGLQTRNVEKHVEHIFGKLEVTSRMAALLRVIELAENMG